MPKEVKKAQEEGAPAWMLTFGDMVTLVLTFFVLLVAMMTVDPKKFVEVLGTFQDASADGSNVPTDTEAIPTEDFFVQIIKASTRRSEMPDGGQVVAAEGDAVRVYSHKENYVVQLGETAFFPEFEVVLTEQAQMRLSRVAEIIRAGKSNRIRLHGHYSQSESFDRFKSLATRNEDGTWSLKLAFQKFNFEKGDLEMSPVILNSHEELAYHRARAVREFFLRQGISSELMEVVAAGQVRDTVVSKAVTTMMNIQTGRIGHNAQPTPVFAGSAEDALPPLVHKGIALSPWPSWVFTEGGVDRGRTVSITVTGEIVKTNEEYIPAAQR